MPRYFRIANWGAIERETGSATVQAMRRLVDAAGRGGGAGEGAVLNQYKITNQYGGGSKPGVFPLRVIGNPPPQIVIGYSDSELWNHGVQSNGDYNLDRGGTVFFQLTADGKLSINEPVDNALLNINVGTAAFAPSDIGNIYLWLDADDLAFSEGQDVSAWNDKSGVSNLSFVDPITSNMPVMRLNDVNGHNSVESAVAGETLLASGGSETYPVGSSFTISVTYYMAPGGFQYIIGAGQGNTLNGFGAPNVGTPTKARFTQQGSQTDVSTGFLGVAGWHVCTLRRSNSGVFDVTFDGVDITDGTPTANSLSYWRNLFIGSGSHFSAAGLKIAELIVYKDAAGNSGKISDADRTQLDNYMLVKYGIGGTAPAGADIGLEIQNGTGDVLVQIDGSGNVGVGTGATGDMDALLHVEGTSRQVRVAYDGSNQLDLDVASDGDTDFSVNGTKVFTITSDGDLGLGIDPPVTRLHVLDSGEPQVRVGYDASNYFEISVESDGDTNLMVDGSDIMTLESGGNVGIGSTDPAYKLEVNGDFRFLGNDRKIWGRDIGGSYIEPYNSSTGDMNFWSAYSLGNFAWYTEDNATAKMKLLYTGDLGVGTPSPGNRLTVTKDTNDPVPTLGVNSGKLSLLKNVGGTLQYGMLLGQAGSGNCWIQVQRVDAAVAYHLLLQPSGGKVGVGIIGDVTPNRMLHVGGTSDQLRLSADATSYLDVLVTANGGVGFAAADGTATNPSFAFNAYTTITNNSQAQMVLRLNGHASQSGYYLGAVNNAADTGLFINSSFEIETLDGNATQKIVLRSHHTEAFNPCFRMIADNTDSATHTTWVANVTDIMTLSMGGTLTVAGGLVAGTTVVADKGIFTNTTEEQLSLRYDGSNYLNVTVASDGDTTFNVDGGDVLTMESGGQVGIGTTSPAYPLEVAGDITATDGMFTAGDMGASNDVVFRAWVEYDSYLRFAAEVNGQLEWGGGVDPLDTTLYRGGADLLRTEDSLQIDVDAYVGSQLGVGTTDPDFALHVYGAASEAYIKVETDSASNIAGFILDGARVANNALGGLYFQNLGTTIGAIIGRRQGANDACDLRFQTMPTGGSLATRMTIDSDGNVGIGIATPETLLHIEKANSGTAPNASADEFFIDCGNSTGGMTIMNTSDNNTGYLVFADEDLNYAGYLAYYHSASDTADKMYVNVADNAASSRRVLTISSANLWIGRGAAEDIVLAFHSDVGYKSLKWDTSEGDFLLNSGLRIDETLQTKAGVINKTDRLTGNTTLTAAHHIVFCDTDGGAFTVTLPAGVEGTNYKIINCGSSGNDLTVDPDGTEQLYGGGAGVAQTLADGEVINIHFNATEGWW